MQFFIQVNASGTGLGAVMLREVVNVLHPCLYASRKRSETETWYVHLLKIPARKWLFRKLFGNFTLQTNHQPSILLQDWSTVLRLAPNGTLLQVGG